MPFGKQQPEGKGFLSPLPFRVSELILLFITPPIDLEIKLN